MMASPLHPPNRAAWTVADLLGFSPPHWSPPPPPRRPSWTRYRLLESMKGLLGVLLGGGVPAGFVAPLTFMVKEASGIPSLGILLLQCILHVASYLICQKAAFMPLEARQRMLLHASIQVISSRYPCSSFMVVLSRNAVTVHKGSSTICSVLLVLCIKNGSLMGYDWFSVVGSTLGLIIMVEPDLLDLDRTTPLNTTFGYVLACLGGMALALGLVIFPTLDFPAKLVTVAFLFGVVGNLVCSPAVFLLQQPVMPLDPLTGTCVAAISFWALVSFLCASYAITKAHPALVCAVLPWKVVVALAVQYYVLREAGAPSDIMGAGVILSSIAIISAQNISCDPAEDNEATIVQLKGNIQPNGAGDPRDSRLQEGPEAGNVQRTHPRGDCSL